MKKFLAAAVSMTLAACNTVDDLRARPISWTAVYPVHFDVMANCLAVRMSEDYAVTPQLYQQERRAMVTGAAKGIGPALFVVEYSVRQISETESEVSLRSIFKPGGMLGGKDESRALADRCARSA